MIKINGNVVGGNISGRNISIVNGKVIIDGQTVALEDKIINVEVTGDVDLISADACSTITVKGNAKNVRSQTGDVIVEGALEGNAQTQTGDIRAGSIGGNASSMTGDVVVK